MCLEFDEWRGLMNGEKDLWETNGPKSSIIVANDLRVNGDG